MSMTAAVRRKFVTEIIQLTSELKNNSAKLVKTDVAEVDLVIIRNMLKGLLIKAGVKENEDES